MLPIEINLNLGGLMKSRSVNNSDMLQRQAMRTTKKTISKPSDAVSNKIHRKDAKTTMVLLELFGDVNVMITSELRKEAVKKTGLKW